MSANSIRYIESLYRAANTPVSGELINCNEPTSRSLSQIAGVVHMVSVEQMPFYIYSVNFENGIHFSRVAGGWVRIYVQVNSCRCNVHDAGGVRSRRMPGICPMIDLSFPRVNIHSPLRNPHCPSMPRRSQQIRTDRSMRSESSRQHTNCSTCLRKVFAVNV